MTARLATLLIKHISVAIIRAVAIICTIGGYDGDTNYVGCYPVKICFHYWVIKDLE